jgi:predicted transposase YdaD
VERFFHYVLNANVDTGVFREKVIEQQSKSLTELAMTLADRFRQEGHQEGLHEGEIRARHQTLLEILEVRFGVVPEGLRETLSTIRDLERLKSLHKAAVTCADLEAFVSDF